MAKSRITESFGIALKLQQTGINSVGDKFTLYEPYYFFRLENGDLLGSYPTKEGLCTNQRQIVKMEDNKYRSLRDKVYETDTDDSGFKISDEEMDKSPYAVGKYVLTWDAMAAEVAAANA